MRTYVRGAAPRPARSAAALLGLLLLAAAATTRAAAIRGPPSSAAAVTQGQARPAPRVANDTTVVVDVCAIKVMDSGPPRFPEVDPLHKYLPQVDAAPLQSTWHSAAEREETVEAPLPEGCEDVGRVGHKMLRCTGANMTTLPDLSLERNVDSLVFVETGIQVVSDVSNLPRTVMSLTFTRGPLVTFDGRRLYQISGLETLSLEQNTLSVWSFVTNFYSPDAPRNASIRALYLQYNLISYPVSEPSLSSPCLAPQPPLLPCHSAISFLHPFPSVPPPHSHGSNSSVYLVSDSSLFQQVHTQPSLAHHNLSFKLL